MKKRWLTYLLFLHIIWVNHTYGQTKAQVWLPEFTACPDSNFVLPVQVAQFDSILAFQFSIGWPSSLKLEKINTINSLLNKDIKFNQKDTTLTVIWTDENLVPFSGDNGDTLFTLVFTKIHPDKIQARVEFFNEETTPIYAQAYKNDVLEDTLQTRAELLYIGNPIEYTKSQDTTLCEGKEAKLSVSVLDSTLVTYLWSTGAIQSNIRAHSEGVYRIQMSNDLGCLVNDSIRVHLLARPQVTLADTLQFCTKSPPIVTLTDTLGKQYRWSTGQKGAQITLSGAGKFWVEASDGTCTNSDTLIAIPYELLDLQIIVKDENCRAANAEILALAKSNSPVLILYQLDTGEKSENGQFSSLEAGTYHLKIYSGETCQLIDTIMVVQDQGNLDFELVSTIPATCNMRNGSLEIKTSGQSGQAKFSLDNRVFSDQPLFSDLAAGNYQVYAKDSFCLISKNVQILKDTSTAIQISTLKTTPAQCNAPNGMLEIGIIGTSSNLVFIIDSIIYNEPVIRELKTGVYKLTVKNEQGCQDTSSFKIVRSDCKVYIPNAFSPNNDQVNDQFVLIASEGFIRTIKSYRIFDRWGNLVYSSPSSNIEFSSFNEWWDGSNYRGERLAQGTYIYSIEVELFPGFDKTYAVYKGEINLLH